MGTRARDARHNFGSRDPSGGITVDDTPGIGVDIDEEAARKYPYSPASLPVARKADGTLFHW